MKRKLIFAAIALLSVVLVAVGCQTYGEAAGLGAAVGAGTGAIIGSQHGNALPGALIGGAVGGLAGLVAHDIKARKERDAAATAAAYKYQPAQGEVLRMESSRALPNVVNRGQLVQGTMQYALLGAGPGEQVTENRQLRRGSDVLGESSSTVVRTDGTWLSTQEFKLPDTALPGQYEMIQTVQTANSRVSGTSTFNVQ